MHKFECMSQRIDVLKCVLYIMSTYMTIGLSMFAFMFESMRGAYAIAVAAPKDGVCFSLMCLALLNMIGKFVYNDT